MDAKKIFIAAVCVVVIVIALIFTVSKQKTSKVAPDEILDAPRYVINVETMEVFTLPIREWEKLGENSLTGYRAYRGADIAMVSVCPNCNKPIPHPPIDQEPPYTCPRCQSKFESAVTYVPSAE